MTQMDFYRALNLDNDTSHGDDDLKLSPMERSRLYGLVGSMHRELEGTDFLGFQIMSVPEKDFVEQDGERILERHGQRIYLREGGSLLHEELRCLMGPDPLINLGDGRVFASTALFGEETESLNVYLFRFVKLGEEEDSAREPETECAG